MLGIAGEHGGLYEAGNSLNEIRNLGARLAGVTPTRLCNLMIRRLGELLKQTREQLDKMRDTFEPRVPTTGR